MSAVIDRELISQAVITLGVCIGTWMLLVEPKAAALSSVEAELARERARLEAVDEKRIRVLSDRVPRMRADVADIETRSRLARDSAALYSKIMALAQEWRVRVRTLQPNVQEGDGQVGVTRIVIAVEGDYDRVASFAHSLRDVETFLRVSTVSVEPGERDGRATTSMKIHCEALAFPMPAELAGLEGSGS